MTNERLSSDLTKEFNTIFNNEKNGVEPPVNTKTDAIVVLSGYGQYDNQGNIITWISPDNIVRIGYAIDIIRRIAQVKNQKNTTTNSDLKHLGLKLFLNGEGSNQENPLINQLDDMKRIALAYNFPSELIETEDCSVEGRSANTKDQMNTINSDLRLVSARHVTLVTSDYHDPRVVRTADLNLRPGLDFDVIPAPQEAWQHYNVAEKMMGEINRIVNYSKQGDLSAYPTRFQHET